MSDLDWTDYAPQTRAIRAGHRRTAEGEQGEAIFTTSSFVFANAAEAAARFAGDIDGNIYSRFTNPTVRTFQERLAAMEGGESCVATASGMAAILSCVMALLRQGDHIVASYSVFGSTIMLFKNYFSRFGVQTSFVAVDDLAAWQAAVRPNTRMFFLETPTNPLNQIADVAALADLAHASNSLLVVDNCFCTPVLQRPLELGADLVVHSATKFLDGQGRCVGGAVVGNADLVGKEIFGFLRNGGPTMSPFNAWVFLKGLETLDVRMRAHCQGARQMARWLSGHPAVETVYYAGLPEHPGHDLARRQQSDFGGIVAFVVKGGQAAAWQVVDSTRLISITANLGDVKSTITHPASTTHGKLSPEEKARSGIAPGLLRLAVGLEAVEDLQRDLGRGLDALVAA